LLRVLKTNGQGKVEVGENVGVRVRTKAISKTAINIMSLVHNIEEGYAD
jgi:hypothetical protein